MEEEALADFNAVLARAQNHNHLSILEEAGWRENIPEQEYWWFTNDSFPGVIIYWWHGTSKGRLS